MQQFVHPACLITCSICSISQRPNPVTYCCAAPNAFACSFTQTSFALRGVQTGIHSDKGPEWQPERFSIALANGESSRCARGVPKTRTGHRL
jgi:hypothetical protein